jgi:hypothetical protein
MINSILLVHVSVSRTWKPPRGIDIRPTGNAPLGVVNRASAEAAHASLIILMYLDLNLRFVIIISFLVVHLDLDAPSTEMSQ